MKSVFSKHYISVLHTWVAYCLVLLSVVLTSICHPVGAWSCLRSMFSLLLTMDLVAHISAICHYFMVFYAEK